MRPLIPLFSRYLLRTYWMLVTVLSVGDKTVTKAMSSASKESAFWWATQMGAQWMLSVPPCL